LAKFGNSLKIIPGSDFMVIKRGNL
jgi:hypothetical protein